MKFYHAFPRPSERIKRSREATDALALQILEGLLRFGLLLTPESLNIPPNPLSLEPEPPQTGVQQRRACFTLMEREELLKPQGHTHAFGEFAIGLDSQEARRLGIMPTIYYYPPDPTAPKRDAVEQALDGGLSREILFRLSESRRLHIALAHLEAASESEPKKFQGRAYLRQAGLILDDEKNAAAELARTDQAAARQILKKFDTDRVDACNLAEWIEIILSLFQTADSKHRHTHLEYFAQREWRVIQMFTEYFHCLPLTEAKMTGLKPRARELALECRRYLTGVLSSGKLNLNLDECHLLAATADRPFRDFIQEIIIPKRLQKQAEQLILLLRQRQWCLDEKSPAGFAVFVRAV